MSNNFQIVHGAKSSNQTQNERNTPTIYTLNTENQFQTLSDIPDSETQTETQIYSYPKGNEINTINDQTENTVEPQNKQSLNSKARELRILISHSSIDILAINESKINDLILDNEININGYNIVCKDRNRSGGGVVLYIRDTVSFSERM